MKTIKHHTVAIQKSIETGARWPLRHFDSRQYTQHNLALGDGLAPLLEFLDSLPVGTSKVEPIRTFEDGDISFAHLRYFLAPMGDVIGFEVHRWQDGRIVEHWDNLQVLPADPQAAAAAADGPTAAEDLGATDVNKNTITQYVRTVLIAGRPALAVSFVDHSLREHSTGLGDGRDKHVRELETRAEHGTRSYTKLHRVLGEGNFVLTMSEGLSSNEPAAFYDLFRLNGGLIAEHWEVVEIIPPREMWRNSNGKF